MHPVSPEQRRHYQEEGYCVLESVIPDELLEILRGHAQAVVDKSDARMRAKGVNQIGLNQLGKRYFSNNPSYDDPQLYRFIFSDLMADISSALLGPDVYTFYEQYVIKGADGGTSFSWHQDSAYVGFDHSRYLTCWCALDDMCIDNGTARILPFSSGIDKLVEHQRDPDSNDLIGYTGDEAGIPVICPAGSIACFTSHTLHSSGNNITDAMRRVYLIQYSSEIIINPEQGKPWSRGEPFIIGGKQLLTPVQHAVH